MGFAQYTHENLSSRSSSPNLTFFDFRVRPEERSPESWENFEGVNIYGYYEIVWFLNSPVYSPVFKYHETNGQDNILCAETFPEFQGACPACSEHQRQKDLYFPSGQQVGKEEYKALLKKLTVGKQRQKLIIPVYVPRRAQQKHIHKGVSEVFPIYWFHINADSWPEGAQDSYLRLRSADDNAPFSANPYMVFKKPRDQQCPRDNYYFKPVPFDPNTMGVYVDHPLLNLPYFNPQNPVQKGWDKSYYDLLELLPVLAFKQAINPVTNQLFEYGQYYQQAMTMYNWCKDNWPAASKRIQVPQQTGAGFQMGQQAPAAMPTQQGQPVYQQPIQQPGFPQQTGYYGQ